MPEITCKWCERRYQAFNNNRKHCSRMDCRNKEIEENLSILRNFVGMFLRHEIIAQIELRCPGNDSFGSQVKVTSECSIDNKLKGKSEVKQTQAFKEELDKLVDYFKPILEKGLKGNFLVKTLTNGKIEPIIMNEAFSLFRQPMILGNNCFISQNFS